MSIFASWAHNYIEMGLSVVPVDPNGKKPIIKNWQTYSDRLPSEEEIDLWCKSYKNANIGVVCGKASGIVCFDYDYEFDPEKCHALGIDYQQFLSDKNWIEPIIRQMIPETPIFKHGKKGWSAFYRYTEGQRTTSCMRYGVTLFDFLSTGRQTVIPPSVHPDTKNPYVFQPNINLYEVLDELKPFPTVILNDIKQEFGQRGKNNSIEENRHMQLLKYAYQIMYSVNSNVEMAERLVSRDKKLFPNNRYLTDLKHHKSSDAKANALEWVPRIKSSHERSLTEEEKKTPVKERKNKNKNSYEVFELFFDDHLSDACTDYVSGVSFHKLGDQWSPIRNYTEVLKSYAIDKKLNDAKVKSHLDRYISELPARLLVEIPEYNGEEWIEQFLSYFEVSNIEHDLFVELMKDWFTKMYGRIWSRRVQNRIVVFKGRQGLGKDEAIEHMFMDLDKYFTSISISSNPDTNFNVIKGLIVSNVPEIDNYKQVSVELLKDLITRNRATYTTKYVAEADEKTLRCSFFATCNKDDVLRDTSGNRRYLIFDIDNIDWNYPKDWSLKLFSQAKWLFENKFKASKMAEKAMAEIVAELTPDDPEAEMLDYFLERYIDVVKSRVVVDQSQKYKLRHRDIDVVLIECAKFFGKGATVRKVSTVLKRNGIKKRDARSVYYEFDKEFVQKCIKNEEYSMETYRQKPSKNINLVK